MGIILLKNKLCVRFFGSEGCGDCARIFVILNKYSIDYDYIDANDPSTKIQEFCDKHNVEQLPHLEFIVNGNIIFTHIGELSEKDFNKIHNLIILMYGD